MARFVGKSDPDVTNQSGWDHLLFSCPHGSNHLCSIGATYSDARNRMGIILGSHVDHDLITVHFDALGNYLGRSLWHQSGEVDTSTDVANECRIVLDNSSS